MTFNSYKEFIHYYDFENVSKKLNKLNRLHRENHLPPMPFVEYDDLIFLSYRKNRDAITKSYFQEFKLYLSNNKINTSYYSHLFLIEDYFDQKDAEYFTDYFLDLICNINEFLKQYEPAEDFLTFIWIMLDLIFHAAFHLVERNEENYKMNLLKMKDIIEKIDPNDEELIKQKIEQFIR